MGKLDVRKLLLGFGCLVIAACSGAAAQSPECIAYLSCYGKTGGTVSTLDTTYGASGTCWTTTSALSKECTANCKKGVAAINDAYPDAGC